MNTFDSKLVGPARALPLTEFRRIPDGFGAGAPHSDTFRAALLPAPGGDWVVCRAPVIPSAFRLLDATVRQVLERRSTGAPIAGAIAILEPRPAKEGKAPELDGNYVRRYQQAVWSAFGVAWVLDEKPDLFPGDPVVPRPRHAAFDALANKVADKLARSPLPKIPKNSRDAEKQVRPIVQSALGSDFKKVSSRYRGFWRRPSADGIWEHPDGCSIALEVKLHEDLTCPLTQAVEPLGRVDGVVYVRVGDAALAKNPAAELAVEAKKVLERNAPVRFLTLETNP